MTWQVEMQPWPTGHVTGPDMFVHLVNCNEAWRRLTKRQQEVLAAGYSTGRLADGTHATLRRRLAEHGLTDDSGALTDAGREVVRWRLVGGKP